MWLARCLTALLLIVSGGIALGDDLPFRTVREFESPDAAQGVAVDADFVYAISGRAISKHRKSDGTLVERWQADADRPLVHMNHGVVRDGVLYAAHSNYPGRPTTSSIEMFDCETLEHIGSHSFGIMEGSLTWIDYHEGRWWGVFAVYSDPEMSFDADTDTRWTMLVEFDEQWQRRRSWIFPPELIKQWEPASNSGGGFGPDGRLYLTGHDAAKLYVVEFPKAGSVMRLAETIPAPIEGQAFAWDRSRPGMFYGIQRSSGEVVQALLSDWNLVEATGAEDRQ